MVKTKLVRLSAKNATQIEDGVFETYMGMSELSNIRSIALKSAIFNNNYPNIQAAGPNQNNEFVYDVGGPIITYTIPEGFYSASDIAALLQIELDAAVKAINPANIVLVSVDPITLKFVFDVSGTAILGLQSSGSLNQAIGAIETFFIGNNIYTVPDFADLAGLQSVSIAVRSKSPKTIINLNPNQGFFTNSLSVVPVNVPWGVNQTFINPDLSGSVLVFSLTENLVKIRFSIRDPDGNPIKNQKNHLIIETTISYD